MCISECNYGWKWMKGSIDEWLEIMLKRDVNDEWVIGWLPYVVEDWGVIFNKVKVAFLKNKVKVIKLVVIKSSRISQPTITSSIINYTLF